MKKILSAFLAAILLLTAVLALSSCGKRPETDLFRVEETLEEKEYTVLLETEAENLDVNEDKTLYARKTVEEGDSYKSYLFRAVTYKDTTSAILAYLELKLQLKSEIHMMKLEIKSTEKILDNYASDLDAEEIEELREDLEDMEEELEEMKDICLGLSGKTVWYASDETVVEATKR